MKRYGEVATEYGVDMLVCRNGPWVRHEDTEVADARIEQAEELFRRALDVVGAESALGVAIAEWLGSPDQLTNQSDDPETVRVIGELGKAMAARDAEIERLRAELEDERAAHIKTFSAYQKLAGSRPAHQLFGERT